MATTPTIILCDNLVDALTETWKPAEPDGVERAYFKRLDDSDNAATKLVGRRVVIFPTDYDNSPVTRGEDGFVHNVSVLVVERFTDGGDPPVDWVDDRADFVYKQIVQGFDFTRQPPAWNLKLSRTSSNVQVCDIEKLVSGGKLFYSLTEIVFEELRDA